MRYALLATFLFAIIGLLMPVKIKIKLHITKGLSNIFINAYVFYGLIHIPVHLVFFSRQGEPLSLVRKQNDGNVKLIYPKSKKSKLSPFFKKITFSDFKTVIYLKRISLYTRIGTSSPALSVFLCGALSNLFTSAMYFLFYDDKINVKTAHYPDFKRKIFILNMECIMYLSPVKIILVVLKIILRLKKRKTERS